MRYDPDRARTTSIGWSDPRTYAGELMWPERFSEKVVSRLEKRLGSWRASGQLQQAPEPAGGGLIKRSWWALWEGDKLPECDFVLACLDSAYTEDTLNDPSGMLVLGVFSEQVNQATRVLDRDGRPMYSNRMSADMPPRICMLHAWDEHLTLHNLANRVEKTCREWKVDLLLTENKASGISLAQEMRRLFGNSNYGLQMFDPKSQDKTARLISIQHLFEEGYVYAPSEKYLWVEKLISQVSQFPKGKHDEFVDLITMGLRFLRANGLISRAPEREVESEELKRYVGRSNSVPLYNC